MTYQELDEIARAARERYRLRVGERAEWIHTRVQAAKDAVTDEARDVFVDLDALNQEATRLENVARDARITESKASTEWPEGAIFCLWVDHTPGTWPRSCPWRIEQRAVVEVVTRETVFPAGRGRASIGTIIMRHLKKDGTPGLNYSRPYGKWLPEGETP